MESSTKPLPEWCEEMGTLLRRSKEAVDYGELKLYIDIAEDICDILHKEYRELLRILPMDVGFSIAFEDNDLHVKDVDRVHPLADSVKARAFLILCKLQALMKDPAVLASEDAQDFINEERELIRIYPEQKRQQESTS